MQQGQGYPLLNTGVDDCAGARRSTESKSVAQLRPAGQAARSLRSRAVVMPQAVPVGAPPQARVALGRPALLAKANVQAAAGATKLTKRKRGSVIVTHTQPYHQLTEPSSDKSPER